MKIKRTYKSHPGKPCIYPKFAWLYAAKDGGPILKGEVRWWHINGWLIHDKNGHKTVSFRRHWS